MVTWSLVTCLIISLGYLLRPDLSLLSWIAPVQPIVQVRYHRHGSREEAATRTRIELHPEDHAYRQPVTYLLDWHVTTGLRRPDGVMKQVYLINGELPRAL